MLRLGELVNIDCCRSNQGSSYCTEASWPVLFCNPFPFSAENGKGTCINTLTNSARAEQLYLLSILHGRIKLCRLMARRGESKPVGKAHARLRRDGSQRCCRSSQKGSFFTEATK
ncbi:hypothetical protein AVEN_131410-1 [Araneus ventricosus]|uniref:Uncharacterized protein n=1 Tax=Araneus ventricosus TaxID=182803 RepID=A0A4Y2QF79_ARAVE|nr:hypothetical protein AVEN_131410-1 [Araneus ventricosus]